MSNQLTLKPLVRRNADNGEAVDLAENSARMVQALYRTEFARQLDLAADLGIENREALEKLDR